MFEPVKNYLKKLSNCLGSIETFGYDSHKGIPFYTGWELKINNNLIIILVVNAMENRKAVNKVVSFAKKYI